MKTVQSTNTTAKAVNKAMKERLNKSLKVSHGENVTSIYRGLFFEDGTSIFCGMVYGNSKKPVNFNFEAPNGEITKTVVIGNATSKTMIRKFLNDHLDVLDDEVIYIVTTSFTIDNESVVKAVFAGDNRGYKLLHLDDVDVISVHEICNNIATTTRKEVA